MIVLKVTVINGCFKVERSRKIITNISKLMINIPVLGELVSITIANPVTPLWNGGPKGICHGPHGSLSLATVECRTPSQGLKQIYL